MSESKMAKAHQDAIAALERLREMAALYQRFETEPESGTVIRFSKQFGNGRKYSYAALRVGRFWYITGNMNLIRGSISNVRSNGAVTFEALIEFIGDSKAWVSSGWTEVPTLNPEIPADDTKLLSEATALLSEAPSDVSYEEQAKALLNLVERHREENELEAQPIRRQTGSIGRSRIDYVPLEY